MRQKALGAFHRHVWQRLPYRWRRAALFGVTAATAPRPTPGVAAALPIIIAGALRTASGLGESARLCHDALRAQGLPVFGIDLTAELMQAEDHAGFVFRDGRGHMAAGTIIVHVNAPLMPLAMLRLGARMTKGKRIVGYWAWELPDLPDDWRHGLPFVHEIWVPSQFVAKAVSALAGARPLHVLPHPVALASGARRQPPRTRATFALLTIFNMASSIARKNPCGTIAAFKRAFGDDPTTRLVVKYANGGVYPDGQRQLERAVGGAANIRLIDAALASAELDALYAETDGLVSLHRSEGFGLTLAEAMLRGLPVIGTDWSGNVDFLDETTGFPIGYQLVSALDGQGTYQHPGMRWAEADIEAAAHAMRRLRADPALAQRLGDAGQRRALQLFGSARYAARAAELLGLPFAGHTG